MASVRNKFGAVDSAIWKHPDFKMLSDDGKLLFLYLKTCDHQNMIGCFHLPVLYIQADLKWSEKRVKQTLSELFAKGFARVDFACEIVLLPKHLIKHPLQNEKQGIGAVKLFDEIPKQFEFIQEIAESILSTERVPKGLAKGMERVRDSVSVSVTETVSVTDEKPRQKIDAKIGEEFKLFYDTYPKKVGREKAFKTFKSARKKTPFDEIIGGLKNQIQNNHFPKDKKYIPHPSTWLNGSQWEDEIIPNVEKKTLEKMSDGDLMKEAERLSLSTKGLNRFQLIDKIKTKTGE